MEEPTKGLAPAEVSTEVVTPTEEPTEELVTPMAMFSKPAEEPDVPLCDMRREKRERCPVVTSPVGWRCCTQPSH